MNVAERLGGRRGLQIGVLTASLLVVLGFLTLDTLGRGQDTRAVWVMTRSVVAGAPLDAASWREQRIATARDQYSYLTSDPQGKFAIHALSPGDILRPDDIESAPLASVPVKLGGYTPSAGDLIDIYAIESGRALLIGRGVSVLSASSIEVPAGDEPLWIAIYGSSATLLSAKSNGTGVPDAPSTSAIEALKRLSRLASGGSVAASPAP